MCGVQGRRWWSCQGSRMWHDDGRRRRRRHRTCVLRLHPRHVSSASRLGKDTAKGSHTCRPVVTLRTRIVLIVLPPPPPLLPRSKGARSSRYSRGCRHSSRRCRDHLLGHKSDGNRPSTRRQLGECRYPVVLIRLLRSSPTLAASGRSDGGGGRCVVCGGKESLDDRCVSRTRGRSSSDQRCLIVRQDGR